MSKFTEYLPPVKSDATSRLLQRLFYGPDALFPRAPRTAPPVKRPDIRVTLTQAHIDLLTEGKELQFIAGLEQTVHLVAPAKYTREYVDSLLDGKHISKVEADIMLRQRA